jgi:hypothetical protein
MATLYRCLIALNGCQGPKYFQAGDSLIKPSYVVMEDDADEVKICSTSGLPIGIAGCPAYHDMNTVFTVGVRVPIYMLGSGVEIMVLHDGAAAASITKGEKVKRSGTTAGMVIDIPAYVAKSTTYAAGDFTEELDTDHFQIGRSTETKTITSGTAAFFKVLLE